MIPSNTPPRALGGLIFVIINLVGLGILWVAEYAYFEITLLILFAMNMTFFARAARKDRNLLLPLLFLIVFSLFHFSLLPISIFDKEYLVLNRYFRLWYFQPYTKEAYWISFVFFLGVVGGAFATKRAVPSTSPDRALEVENDKRSDITLLIFASLVAYFLVVVFFLLGVRSYTQYHEIARSQSASLVQLSILLLYPAIGACAMVCAARTRSLRLFLLLFGVWAVPAFATGLRGEVLFPAALMLPLLLRRLRARFKFIPTVLGSFALLWLISFGRIVRRNGDWAAALDGASPVDALAELGGSLRPVYEVARWTETGILNHLWGGSYWAPIERLLQRLMPFVDPIPALLDDRLMNVTIVKLTGGSYGFSIAAEAFINFGYPGAAVIGLVTGYLLARIGRQFTTANVGILSAALAYALFFHIRQSYVGAWGSFIIVAGFAWLLIKLDHTARAFLKSPNLHGLPANLSNLHGERQAER